ncbi:methylenetetrahydrofolate reductase [Candidatus Nitrosocosmicus arcticus]|uniref:Putative 5, 10-methylenetetrahydrofolate reductase n=1 Tax=Candidatus Nitrosocosmicus arcticus TaxID=2035267 RepID=A0A557STA8_9ARCH|nr:methylenetetrahydrofolate reductase [Candidatus Nitrosocosmicus arcticus]TVP39835.1 putative 5, 10-methylenetetrahydrofolate reductase [Candidatus Nitrosocosmicus arcticus]
MNIIYELNPPKILNSYRIDIALLNQELLKFLNRARIISNFTKYIHITDSVLGIPRFSSIHAAQMMMNNLTNVALNISCSVRTRDRNMNSIIQMVTDAVLLKIRGLLFIQGDKPAFEESENASSLSNPTDVIKLLTSIGFDKLIDLDLSIPNKISNQKVFQKKVNSKPHTFITQSINSIQEIRDLKDLIKPKNIQLIPCIMVPSVKNERAAAMIGLDWSEYQDNFLGFLKEVYQETDHILITSPNSFDEGIEVLKKIV